MDDATPVDDAPRRGLRARLDRHGLVLEDASREECLRFDADGCWVAWHRGGAVARRSRMHDAFLRRGGRFEPAGPVVTRAVEGAAADRARGVRVALERDAASPAEAGTSDVVRALARAEAWDEGRHDAARRDARLAHPEGIPILPPHRTRDLVLDAARGCPNGSCTFCAFYRGRRFEPLDDAEFDRHLEHVRRLGGSEQASRDGVFLGAASAASLPDATLLRRLRRLDEALGRRPRGVAAFLDPDHAPRRDGAKWTRLRDAGLGDVTVGLETGDADLRAAAGKSGDVGAFVEVVRRAKSGGTRVAVSVLVGLGGPAVARRHLEATCAALGRMGLDAGDLVYLSPLDEFRAGGAPPEEARSEEPGADGTAAWRDALVFTTAARAAPYRAAAFAPLA